MASLARLAASPPSDAGGESGAGAVAVGRPPSRGATVARPPSRGATSAGGASGSRPAGAAPAHGSPSGSAGSSSGGSSAGSKGRSAYGSVGLTRTIVGAPADPRAVVHRARPAPPGWACGPRCATASDGSGPHVHDHAPVDPALLHLGEDRVDVVEGAHRVRGADLAAREEVERLRHVLARPDDRPAHGEPEEHGREDVEP